MIFNGLPWKQTEIILPYPVDHFQFTLIHGPNITGSYEMLFFETLDFTFINGHIHNWVLFCFGSISSFFLGLFIYSFLVACCSIFLSDQCKEIEENNRMGKTRDLFKKTRDTKGIFHAKMGSIMDRKGMDLTEADVIKNMWKEYTE